MTDLQLGCRVVTGAEMELEAALDMTGPPRAPMGVTYLLLPYHHHCSLPSMDLLLRVLLRGWFRATLVAVRLGVGYWAPPAWGLLPRGAATEQTGYSGGLTHLAEGITVHHQGQ